MMMPTMAKITMPMPSHILQEDVLTLQGVLENYLRMLALSYKLSKGRDYSA